MRVVAIMPIKLQNERCPGKNIRLLGDKPLLQYELNALSESKVCDDIYVYCSSREIEEYLPKEVQFLQRSERLDYATANFNQIFSAFCTQVDADIYIYAHATAPFISSNTIVECFNAVKSGRYDSAFCARKIQSFLWKDGEPLNFDGHNLPRTQDLDIIYQETSGIYVFTKDVFIKYGRRIGIKPYMKCVNFKEQIDIDNPEDFAVAEKMLDLDI